MPDDRFHRLLEQQLAMNPQTWSALEERGIDARTLLVIEFSFTAPGRRQARQLVKVLRARTNFSADIVGDGPLLKRHWRVVGHTQPATASVEMLNDWVTFMVTLGAKNGACRFDGWGVKLPETQPGEAPDELPQELQGDRRNGHHVAEPAADTGADETGA
jgi:Regulator of ribonuclease activity B